MKFWAAIVAFLTGALSLFGLSRLSRDAERGKQAQDRIDSIKTKRKIDEKVDRTDRAALNDELRAKR